MPSSTAVITFGGGVINATLAFRTVFVEGKSEPIEDFAKGRVIGISSILERDGQILKDAFLEPCGNTGGGVSDMKKEGI